MDSNTNFLQRRLADSRTNNLVPGNLTLRTLDKWPMNWNLRYTPKCIVVENSKSWLQLENRNRVVKL